MAWFNLTNRLAANYWDLNRQIRIEINNALALMSSPNANWARVLTNAEWLGAEVEEEIERVRREESQHRG